MKKYKVLLLDVDDTLLDFKLAEKNLLNEVLVEQKLTLTTEFIKIFATNNQIAWKKIEQEFEKKEFWLIWRFAETLRKLDLEGNACMMDIRFRERLAYQHQTLGASLVVIEKLYKQGFSIQIVTNGAGDTQRKRLADACFSPYIDAYFISDELSVQKPNPLFFTQVFKANPTVERSEFLLIGDSLTSDMLGGYLSNIDTVYLSSDLVTSTAVPVTYQISEIQELVELLTEK